MSDRPLRTPAGWTAHVEINRRTFLFGTITKGRRGLNVVLAIYRRVGDGSFRSTPLRLIFYVGALPALEQMIGELRWQLGALAPSHDPKAPANDAGRD